MEHVCRRFRRAALSLPCHLRLTDHLSLENGRKGVLRCLRGRVPADLQLQWSWLYEDPRSGELLGLQVAEVLPTVTRWVLSAAA